MAGSTYEKIASTTAAGGSTSVTLSSIPATYTDLVLVASGSNSAQTDFKVRFNSDTNTNYSNTALYSDGSTTSSFKESNVTFCSLQFASSGTNIITINNYSNTTTYKSILSRINVTPYVMAIVSLYRSTSAINSITCFVTSGSYNAGTTFTIYGILKA